MKYMIVTNRYYSGVEKEVGHLMKNGWEPTGGISFDKDIYLQAMIKKDKKTINTY